jgi:hypothetical protein
VLRGILNQPSDEKRGLHALFGFLPSRASRTAGHREDDGGEEVIVSGRRAAGAAPPPADTG